MEELLASLNQHGFAFDRDFVLKTCLVVLGQGARYEVEKFRKVGVRDEIEAKWDEIAEAIQDVLDFVRGKTFIRTGKALPTYLVLIPLVYLRYRFPSGWEDAVGKETYILRCSLTGAFSGQPDNLIDALVRKLDELGTFDLEEFFGVMRTQGRSLELTQERLWQMGYNSDSIHLLFNLWYPFNYTPAYENNLPQVDHIFPLSELRKVRIKNPNTGRNDLLKYRESERNQLANCELLKMSENGPGGKGSKLPEEWFAGKDNAYLDLHSIPKNQDLWKLERFEDFIAARKELILERFKTIRILALDVGPAPPP